MVKFLRIGLLVGILSFFCFPEASAQNIRMRDGRINACEGEFTDSGGTGLFGNYGNNENFTFTICPDEPGRRVSLLFETFRVSDEDVLCFYDGENTSAQLLSCWDDKESQTGPIVTGGFDRTMQATLENQSGCLTITFQSNRSGRGFGWRSLISCVFACQDINAQIASSTPAIVPADTGWIDLCVGEPLTLTGQGEYPESGGARNYTQSDATSTFTWDLGDGTIREGQTITHFYDKPGGYIIDLKIKDNLGCTNNNALTQRVRVGAPPKIFLAPPDTLCIGDTISLTTAANQGIIPEKTVSVVPDSGSFQAVNIRADSIALPDGEGVFYESEIRFNTFNPGQVVTSESDIKNIFVNMEHTWMRDLEIEIECPNGQIMTLHNFDGQRGREVFLGSPNDNDNNNIIIGEGLTYIWSSEGEKTWINYANQDLRGVNDEVLPAQEYAPFDDFTELIGCPLNGNWTMRIKDLWLFDNGFIFFWGIELDESIIPTDPETFVPEVQSYSWSGSDIVFANPDSSLAIAQNDGALTYTFVAEDEFGCQNDTTITFQVLPEDDPLCLKCETRFVDLQDQLISCGGEPVNLEIRTDPELDFYNQFTYSWTPTEGLSCSDCPNPIANPSSPTTYSVSVTNGVNCDYQDQVNITISNDPPPTIGIIEVDPQVCESDPLASAIASVSGGTGTITYNWGIDPSQNSSSISDLAPGNYTLMITDVNGCFDEATFEVPAPSAGPSVQFESTNIDCQGDATGSVSAIVTGGLAPYTYQWNNDSTGSRIENLTAGEYTLTVTDANGCTNLMSPVNSVSIVEPNTPKPTASIEITSPILCKGSASGVLSATAINGQPPYSYEWNNAATTSTIDQVAAGTYEVTITDSGGCSDVAAVTLEDPTDLVTLSIINPILLCANDATGIINAVPVSGTPPYRYQWSNGATTQNITDLSSGTYILNIEDANGCTESDTISLEAPNSIEVNPIITNEILCSGDATGSLSLEVAGGSPPYNYQWSTGAITQTVSGLNAGIYSYTVTDDNNCSTDSSIVLEEPELLDFSLDITSPSCFGLNDGVLSINATGGISPYTYQLNDNNPIENNIITGLMGGAQDVSLIDANGCVETSQVTVNEPEELIVTASANPEDINLGESTILSAEGINGIGIIDYQWSTFDTTKIECDDCQDAEVRPLRSTNFQVVATDENNCQTSDFIQVNVEIDRSIMVPTGFTPDGEGAFENNLLHVHGRPGTFINRFQIYNRWGELMYESDGFEINDMNFGWDGNFRGRPAPADAYIWRLEATFLDGYQKAYEGETNLIR